MAIVNCPNCAQRISDRAAVCPNCQFAIGEVAPEVIEKTRIRRRREQIYRLRMASYTALTLFVAGVIWYWFSSNGFQSPPARGPILVMATGALAYFVLRVVTIWVRRQPKP